MNQLIIWQVIAIVGVTAAVLFLSLWNGERFSSKYWERMWNREMEHHSRALSIYRKRLKAMGDPKWKSATAYRFDKYSHY